MSKTKNLAIRIARMVYEFRYRDADIIDTLTTPGLTGDAKIEEREWLQEQIDTVRANPNHFKQYIGRDT